jgi:hypothetical protein
MRIRFRALSPSDEDLSKTRPEGPKARARVSEKAPKPDAKPASRASSSAPRAVEKRPREETQKIRVHEEAAPDPKRRDPRRE